MSLSLRLCLLAGLVLPMEISAAEEKTPSNSAPVAFSKDIQPLFAKHCLLCHGPDQQEGGLRLDLPDRAIATLDSGRHAVVPGNIDQSELLRRVLTSAPDERMPPEGSPLSKEQVEQLRQWIASGAKYERHWAYEPIVNPTLPELPSEDAKTWTSQHPIDRFIFARLATTGIPPSPTADRYTLIKRLYYDLLGLPPTPEEVDSFVNDSRDDAYQLLVDHLLDSPHFGERWGRHWLDMARYADSDGYEKDRARPDAWRYRDWVIQAINKDLPFNRFTVEQLAGDLLPSASSDQKLATAFHRQTLTNTEGGTDQEEFRVEATFDRTETTAAVWMGLTMTCARCHSHKYDQISQQEYYQLFSFFNNANEANLDIAESEQAVERFNQEKAKYEAKLAELEHQVNASRTRLAPEIEAWTQQVTSQLKSEGEPLSFQPIKFVAATSQSGAELVPQEDGSFLVSGNLTDKDRYTIICEAPAKPLTGVRLEVLTDPTLPQNGPGRAPNGNFVLNELHTSVSSTHDFSQASMVQFAAAEADYSQARFAPDNILNPQRKTGWAVGGQTGRPHELTLLLGKPVPCQPETFVQIVLDQSYGGNHTLGRFRLSFLSGSDPLRSLPKPLVEALRIDAETRTVAQNLLIADHVAKLDPEARKSLDALEALKKKAPKSPLMAVRVMAPAKRTTRLLYRGDFLQPAEEVDSQAIGVIEQTHPLPSRQPGSPADRLDLAEWLVSPEHPLTARVTVNHVWARLFGRGIVATVNDFGVQGEPPSHPQLLDWLAWNFSREMNWSRKHLIRTIVTSATYRQSSAHRPELLSVDATNRLFARQNRIRVEAEIIRDLHLSAGGLLADKIGGPSVFPPLPAGVAELSYANNFSWKTSEGADRYRRGMYTFFKRTAPHPTLISFDCPDSNTTNLKRDISNTPLQALTTLNNEVFTEAAQAMVARIWNQAVADDKAKLSYALRLCLIRLPRTQEIDRLADLLMVAREFYQSHPDDAKKLVKRHPVSTIDAAENAAWVATIRVVMNLDEFIVRD